jgi:hypothetical protein
MLTASDGHAYVVKVTNNPQSVRVLANEWLASSIGRAPVDDRAEPQPSSTKLGQAWPAL